MQTIGKRLLVTVLSILMIVSLTPAMAFASSSAGSMQLADEYDWDSTTWAGGLDFSWYDENDVKTSYHLTTAAQWEALAWICSERLDDLSDYATKTVGNVTAIKGTIPTSQNTFTGVQFYLDNDLDMGGVNDNGTWSGPNYYPIGTACASDLAVKNQTDSKGITWYGSFYGSFDGQGHIVKNIFCDRTGEFYKDSQMCALFGRVGAADGTSTPDANIVIKNVAATGYINGSRSCAGIVGKTLHVSSGYSVTVENCLNFASVKTNNGAKGVGGVVGALWNGGIVNNCANFGSVTGTYSSANAAGISGAAEGPTSNSYNVGTVVNTYKAANSAAVALNQMSANVTNCYALEGTCPGYTTSIVNGNTLVSGGWKTADEMKSDEFVSLLNTDNDGAWAFPYESDPIAAVLAEYGVSGYPVPSVFVEPDAITVITDKTVGLTESKLNSLEGEASTKSYTGKSGAVEITAKYISLTDVLEAAGADPEKMAYPLTLTAGDGFTREITAEELPNMYLFKQEDGTYRSAMDGSAGKYWVSGIVSISEHVHTYGTDGMCSCGQEDQYLTVTVNGEDKKVHFVTLTSLEGEESTKGYTGKSGAVEITAKYISLNDVLEAAGTDPKEMAYPLTLKAGDGFTREITAEELPNMYLFKQEDGTYRSAMDGSAGKYWVSGIVAIAEHVHDFGTNGICACGEKKAVSAYLTNVSVSPIMYNSSFTADLYIASDAVVNAAEMNLSCENGTIEEITCNEAVSDIKGLNGKISFYGNKIACADGLKLASVVVKPDTSGKDITLKIEESSIVGINDSLAEDIFTLGEDAAVTVGVITADDFSCSDYVSAAEKKLIKYTGEVPERMIPSYNGEEMTYSEKLSGWILLSDKDTSEELGTVTFAEGKKEPVDYSGDVNNNGKVNIIDAQVAYDISTGKYTDFTKADMAMWLRSDVNASGDVTSLDARGIQSIVHGAVVE